MDMDFSEIIPALPALWDGMVMTLQLMVMGVVGGIALGTVLALMRLSSSKLLANIAGAYVNYFRSIPLLLVITWFYLAVPFVRAVREIQPHDIDTQLRRDLAHILAAALEHKR